MFSTGPQFFKTWLDGGSCSMLLGPIHEKKLQECLFGVDLELVFPENVLSAS